MTRLFAGTPFDIPPKCEDCSQLETECVCTPAEKSAAEAQRTRDTDRLPAADQTARVSIEKRKGGRVVTLIDGLSAKANDLPELLTQLQASCGTGGTVKAKENRIELQGNHVVSAARVLSEIGYRVKQ